MITWHSCFWCRRRCEQLVRTMPHHPAIRHGHQWVFSQPATDTLYMPIPPCCQSPEASDATLCHEPQHRASVAVAPHDADRSVPVWLPRLGAGRVGGRDERRVPVWGVRDRERHDRLLPTSVREIRFSMAYSHPYEKNPMVWRLS